MSVSPSEVFAYLVQKHGVSTASAAGILANIKYESGFNPSAVGDGGTSGGLFQHHAGRWDSLKRYARSSGRSWDDWKAQVDFAIKEARGMGIDLQSSDPVSSSKEWTIRFERPADMHRKAEQRAKDVGLYMNLDPNSNYSPNPGSGDAMADEGQEELNIPEGGSWFQVDGNYYVAYRFYADDSQKGPSAVNYYQALGPPPQGTKLHSARTFNKYKDQWVDGGTVDAFRGVSPGTSYQDLVNETLFELGLSGSDALGDKGVMDIVALAMTRELSDAELSNRLRKTQWYQSHTDKQREWDDLSEAEKEQRTVDEAMKLTSSWFTYVGEDLQIADYDQDGDGHISSVELRQGNPDLFTWAQRIAKGEATSATAINQWMKDVAIEDPNSPWGRTVRKEEQQRGEFDVDVSTMAGQIKDLYNEWGVTITDKKAEQLANEVVMNRQSLEEVEEALKEQANGLYPNKPPNMSTMQYAQPYMQQLMQTLEVTEPSLKNKWVQKGISSGMNLAEFEEQLRQDDQWLETKNARTEMNTKISQLGRTMGF